VARIPRISGGGTSRAGQGAFGNQVRGGRMFAPTKIWRKWHRKINTNQKRFAVASALAASALTSLVMARGHRIDGIPEVPLVVTDEVQSLTKTKQAIDVLKALNAYGDVEKARDSRKLRCGVGKMRNRRHVQRRGPLIVFAEDKGITLAFRNLPGVELCQVDRLNLLQLAPGGHLGRFVIWTKTALQTLDANWGSVTRQSVSKKGYTLPRPLMIQSDLTRLINSDEIQSKVRPAIKTVRRARQKKNPLLNLGAMVALNPYALALRRSEILTSTRRAALRKATIEAKRKGIKLSELKEDSKEAPKAVIKLSKRIAEQARADAKANKTHRAFKSRNYKRLASSGTPDRKPVVLEEPVTKPVIRPPGKDSKAPAGAKLDAKAVPPPAPAGKPAAADKKQGDKKDKDAKKGEKKPDKKKPDDKKA